MSTLDLHPFDLMFRNFFDNGTEFRTALNSKVQHPVDISETDDGLQIEIAAVGVDKQDLELQTQGDTLRVAYRKDNRPAHEYIHKGIARRNFDLGWRLARKFDLEKIDAKLDKGLLCIKVPYTNEQATKKVSIS